MRKIIIYNVCIAGVSWVYKTKIGTCEQDHHKTRGGGSMKKLSFLLATLGFTLLAGTVSSGVTHAESGTATCPINFTGPDSKNICTSETHYTCKVNNDNQVMFYNENNQNVGTGDAVSAGNTSAGGAMTGTATNSNGTTFTATITNGNDCVATATVPATVVPASSQPVAPVAAPTGGAGATTPAAGGMGATVPQVLPNTAASSPLTAGAVVLGTAGLIVVLARLAVVAYGRLGA